MVWGNSFTNSRTGTHRLGAACHEDIAAALLESVLLGMPEGQLSFNRAYGTREASILKRKKSGLTHEHELAGGKSYRQEPAKW